jgi:hypothetical protein
MIGKKSFITLDRQNFTVWKAVALVLTGFVGGIFTAIAGSGVDICSFSILSLLFRFETGFTG